MSVAFDIVVIGGVRLDTERGEIRREDGTSVTLRPKTLELLRLLLARRGRLAARAEILDAIWPDVHVTDDSITQCVVELRRALGPEGGRLKTLPKRGYILEMPEAPGLPAAALPPAVATGVASPGGAPVVAVLPFRVPTRESNLAAVADAVLDGVVGALATLREPVVISANSSRPFAGLPMPLTEVGRRLGAQYLASGSLRPVGGVLRLAVELAESSTSAVLWRRNYDLPAEISPEVEDNVAAVIAHTLVPRVQEAELRRGRRQAPSDWNAYQLLLEARQMIFRLEAAAFEAAGVLLRRAIAMDPGFAGGHAALANWYSLRLGQGWSRDRGADLKGLESAATQAIRLDGQNARALALLAHNRAVLLKDHATAFEMFARALDLAPNESEAWLWSSPTHALTGHAKEAVRRAERALRLSPEDPLVFRHHHFLSMAHYHDGDWEACAHWGLRSREANPRYTSNLRTTLAALAALGRTAEARHLAHEVLAIEPDFRVGRFMANYSSADPARGDAYARQLLDAGLPA